MSSSQFKLLSRIRMKKNFWKPISVSSMFILAYVMFSYYQTIVSENTRSWGQLCSLLLTMLVFSLIFDVFLVGLHRYFLNVAFQGDGLFHDLLYGLKKSPDRIIVLSLLRHLITKLPLLPGLLCTFAFYVRNCDMELLAAGGILLLVIGGIAGYVLSLIYSQCLFLLAEDENLSAMDALRRSRRLMHGRKEQLFALQISFLPLFIAGFFTLYLGFFIAIPYYCLSTAFFYLELTDRISREMFYHEE